MLLYSANKKDKYSIHIQDIILTSNMAINRLLSTIIQFFLQSLIINKYHNAVKRQ
jgi:hypothetical protein